MKHKKGKKDVLLAKIRKVFPHVTRVVDATESIRINVTDADNVTGRKKDFAECALAKACKRTRVADGTLIGMAYSYLINGNTATRYATSAAVAREITSFDRHQDFATGRNYCLSKISPSNALGRKDPRGPRTGHRTGGHPQKKIVHRTANVRHLQEL